LRARFVTLAEGIEEVVRDEDRVAFEGFTHLIPFAAGHEAIRQRRTHLELVRMTPDILYDQMVGCGMARRLVFSWCGNPGVGSLHRIRDALERSWPAALEFEEYTHAAMAAAYDAGTAQIDRHANLNTTVVGAYDKPRVRLPGAGGASEAGAQCREIFIIVKQSPRSFVARLDFLTTYGHGTGHDERQRLGITTKGPTQVISDLCHLQPDPTTRELKVVSLHPGVTRQHAIDATAWDLQFADRVTETPPPTEEELRVLRELKARGEV
jgi:hypothetical protein